MEAQIKCSSEEHKEINAVKYCPQCGIYLCNKCDNYHSPLFKNHHPFKLNKDTEIWIMYCKIK